jgi:transcription-repair coupling factor (superfamily II helicase)
MKGEVGPDEAGINSIFGLNIRIPSDYIAEENQRLRMWQAGCMWRRSRSWGTCVMELTDRYGKPPGAVRNLLEYAKLKLAAMEAGATVIERKRDLVNIASPECAIDPQAGALCGFSADQIEFT